MKPKTQLPQPQLESEIAHYARQYLDVQKVRIALGNQINKIEEKYGGQGALTRLLSADDMTGGGFGAHVEHLKRIETVLTRQIERHARQHFMREWVDTTKGIGLLGFGLLIGITYASDTPGRVPAKNVIPRSQLYGAGSIGCFATVSKLWKYLGMDVREDGRAPRRAKGQTLGYSPQGRVLCHQIGESIVKVGGPYRLLYDTKKAAYLARERRGPSDCPFGQAHKDAGGKAIKCGTAHAHNAAMRYAVKCLLRDLWVEWMRTQPAAV